jgi:hypothetical protein
VADAPDSLREPMHDAKKLDNGRKVRIERMLEFGLRAPAGCIGIELSNIGLDWLAIYDKDRFTSSFFPTPGAFPVSRDVLPSMIEQIIHVR